MLFTTQPGVSKMIRSLESEIGIDIFVRRGNRLIGLTDEGREAYALARRMLQDAHSLQRLHTSSGRSEITGVLHVGTTPIHARYRLPSLTQRFLEAYPKVQLERFVEAWKRLNQSGLGAAALSTSSFPVDRNRLATLLGFDRLIENAYDANHFAPFDSALDYANTLSVCAVQIGQFAQDIHAQYAAPVPWLTLQAGDLIGVSSLMPQKRNPAALEQLRAQCSLLLADMRGPFMLAHNVRTGMFDHRAYDPLPTTRPVAMLALFERVVRALIVNREQARAELQRLTAELAH